ncbi:AAA family ATPase [Rhizobium leguminosarum]
MAIIAGETTTISIWDALDGWGKSLPDWQKYTVAYAVRDGNLSGERIGEAYKLYLIGAGLVAAQGLLPPIPASITGRPDAADTTPLLLEGIKNPVRINAIPSTSELKFGKGLTIIYGHNGAGKSGFARMLGSACFSRSEQEILPNVYDTSTTSTRASFDIDISRGQGRVETLSVEAGTEHAVLRRVSVFDSAIARVHLAEETPLGFQPVGFDVFDEVVRVIDLIGKRLDADIAERRTPNKFVNMFLGTSAIKTQVEALSEDTNIDDLRRLAVYGEPESVRLSEIDGQITDLRSKSPADLIAQREAAKRDVAALESRIRVTAQELGADACTTFIKQLDQLKVKIAAALAASLGKIGSSELVRTGDAEWERFAKSARTFGRAEKENYPVTGDPCLLCHRPLDEPSVSLIRRFWSFLGDESRVAAEEANSALNRVIEALNAIDLDLLPDDGRVRADLLKMTPDFVRTIDEFATRARVRRAQIIAYLERSAEAPPEGDLVGIGGDIFNWRRNIQMEIVLLQEDSVEEALAARMAEHVELRHKQVLSQNIEDICTFIGNLKWIDNAAAARKSLTTRFVTDKQKELFQVLIEGKYKDRLKLECKEVSAALPIEFKARGRGGQTLRGLQIQGGRRPHEVLSEGEQRAVALADFLTEVNLNPTSAGIVLDDPVTSLDHKRKKKIAARLSREAKVRQVIVFTHDLVFMSNLLDAAKAESVEIATHWIDRAEDGAPGHVVHDECPANSDAYKTPHRAKEFLAKAKKAIGRERVDNVRAGASALRNTLEEIIIRDVLKGTVKRWDEQVRIGNLREIDWSNEIADEICKLQDDISRLIDAHSTSDEFGGGMPEPDELEQLITRVEAAQAEAKKKRK